MNKETAIQLVNEYDVKTRHEFVKAVISNIKAVVGKDLLETLEQEYTRAILAQREVLTVLSAEYPVLKSMIDASSYYYPMRNILEDNAQRFIDAIYSNMQNTGAINKQYKEIIEKFEGVTTAMKKARSSKALQEIVDRLGLGIVIDSNITGTVDYEFVRNAITSLKALPAPVVEESEA